MTTRVEQNVNLTRRLREWLSRTGLKHEGTQAGIAVDAADIVAAAEQVNGLLEAMMRTNPESPGGADEALTAAAEIEVQLFTELRSHLETLEEAWPKLLECLDTASQP